ncbi:MAG: hypothetical protein HGA42_00550 [Nostocales cyanobacterium W4_Combined_metabat2_030]|nr:hypothetical protein [Nostocales cyanobacterium W4_Combined_metabat2_030]
MKKNKIIHQFDTANMVFNGLGRDVNGNRIIKVGFLNKRGFSIQTNNGLMPISNGVSMSNKVSDFNAKELQSIEEEVINYVKKFGSLAQKKALKIYGSTLSGSDSESLRTVKVTYSNGESITTSMAAHLTDTEIKAYFRIGKTFNIGNGAKDLMVQVKSVKILDKKLGGVKMKKVVKKTVRKSTTPKKATKRPAHKTTIKKLSLAKTAIKQASELVTELKRAVTSGKAQKKPILATIAKVKTRVARVKKSLGTIKA